MKPSRQGIAAIIEQAITETAKELQPHVHVPALPAHRAYRAGERAYVRLAERGWVADPGDLPEDATEDQVAERMMIAWSDRWLAASALAKEQHRGGPRERPELLAPCATCSSEANVECRPVHGGEREGGGWSHPGRSAPELPASAGPGLDKALRLARAIIHGVESPVASEHVSPADAVTLARGVLGLVADRQRLKAERFGIASGMGRGANVRSVSMLYLQSLARELDGIVGTPHVAADIQPGRLRDVAMRLATGVLQYARGTMGEHGGGNWPRLARDYADGDAEATIAIARGETPALSTISPEDVRVGDLLVAEPVMQHVEAGQPLSMDLRRPRGGQAPNVRVVDVRYDRANRRSVSFVRLVVRDHTTECAFDVRDEHGAPITGPQILNAWFYGEGGETAVHVDDAAFFEHGHGRWRLTMRARGRGMVHVVIGDDETVPIRTVARIGV